MKLRILILSLFTFLITTSVLGDDKDKAIESSIGKFANSLSNAMESLLSGGDERANSEVKISGGKNLKPTFSIMSIRPLSPHNDDSALFAQLQLNNVMVRGDARIAINAGLAKRYLSEDKNTIRGINAFIDYDEEGNARASIGLEIKRSAFEAILNYYTNISNAQTVGDYTERVLTGGEISLIGEVPYFPWANIIYKRQEWSAEKNTNDSESDKLSIEMQLTPHVILEGGVDDNNIDGQQNFVKLFLVFPPRESVAATTTFVGETAFSSGDISLELFSKVRRSNSMVIESEGSGVTIARAAE